MIAVRLSADHSTAVVAAPSYREEIGMPNNPNELQQHLCIGYRVANGDREFETAFEPSLIVDDIQIAACGAALGLGLVYVPRDAVEKQLEIGTLAEVLQPRSGKMPGDFLYYPSRRILSPAARTVINHLRMRGT